MLQTTLISSLGPNVNLANIAFGGVIGLETLRLGIRSGTLHLFDASGDSYAVPQPNRASFGHPDRRDSSRLIVDRNRGRRNALQVVATARRARGVADAGY